ncbi:MAG: ABC transporter ATP-binding protein [Candidatus Promineifilaceae bacterium]|nr:ABC transporter ATP-binding protein [Candidatus Promineifilaceae bacterium]
MIEVRDLSKYFGKLAALDGLTFEVQTGEAVALWGENGAGKTTALRCLLGMIPYQGVIRVGGCDSTYQGKQVRRLTGFVPQILQFPGYMTVLQTLAFHADLRRISVTGDRIKALLDMLGLTALRQQEVANLSGGMKQRLALVMALLDDPPLLVLDEPTANLDVRARASFFELLSAQKENGKTLVFSSHRPEEVITLADRVLVLEDGRLTADLQPETLNHRLTGEAMLKLYFADETAIEPALKALLGHGFQAERNGSGVWVAVPPLQKASPIALLAKAGLPVTDFQVERN